MVAAQMKLFSLIAEGKWGEKSLVALYCSIGSGVVLSLQYEVVSPFYSVSVIDTLVPFGSFWRSFHFFSSQIFFLFLAVHLLAVIPEKISKLEPYRWMMLIASIPVVILLLFSGYVLRGDATGDSAGIIAENIVLAVPFFGEWLNSLLFFIQSDGMKRIYANHLINFGVIWLILCWDHLRRYKANIKGHGLLLCCLLAFCLWLPAPMEPARFGMLHISGPWFFLGLQELLRYVDPFIAGVLFPSTAIIALCLSRQEGTVRRGSLLFLVIWLAIYTVLTVVSAMR